MNEIVPIQRLIFEIRGQQVMLDRDLAMLYGVETKVLNQAVRRNLNRFPPDFMFTLKVSEYQEVVTNCDRFASLKYSTVMPHAFTEHGIIMLASVLRSEVAIQMSVQITRAFVAMRQYISLPPQERLQQLEQKVDGIKEYIEEILSDQNDINEETQAQLELINKALAGLLVQPKPTNKALAGLLVQPKPTNKPIKPIGFATYDTDK